MQTKTVEKVLKKSLLYTAAMAQPFAVTSALFTAIEDISVFADKQLQFGDHGELVRHVQLKLKKLGYYNEDVDGIYGLYTEHAIRSLQSSSSISIDGIVDEETFEKLLHREKKSAFKEIESHMMEIKPGDKNEIVVKVQEVLYFYGYYRGQIDGIYGPLTGEAIKKVKAAGFFDEFDERSNEAQRKKPKETKAKKDSSDANQKTSLTEAEKENTPLSITQEGSIDEQKIIAEAKEHIGTPYVWGGSSPNGFDCSGFIQFVYDSNNITIPRTVNEIWNFSESVSSPSVGDLVFFETYQPGPSHMGIYLGDGNFIHAGSSNGVEISNYDETDYWKERYLGAKRITN